MLDYFPRLAERARELYPRELCHDTYCLRFKAEN